MKNKLIILITIVIAIIAITIVKKDNSATNTTFENNQAVSNVEIEEITFKNIQKEYTGNITSITADVYNNTEKNKSINVKIVLKDEKGKELKSMIQVIENIEPGRKKLLQTGIVGDYSGATDVEFEVLSDREIEKYN